MSYKILPFVSENSAYYFGKLSLCFRADAATNRVRMACVSGKRRLHFPKPIMTYQFGKLWSLSSTNSENSILRFRVIRAYQQAKPVPTITVNRTLPTRKTFVRNSLVISNDLRWYIYFYSIFYRRNIL